MYCTNCGIHTNDADKFCRECGHETPVGRDAHWQDILGHGAPRRLCRLTSEKKIAGVCSGLAQYLDVDATLVWLVVATATLFSGGLGLVAYIVAWIIIPSDNRVAPLRSPAGAPTPTAT